MARALVYSLFGVLLGGAAALLAGGAPAAVTASGEHGLALFKLVFETARDKDAFVDTPDEVKNDQKVIDAYLGVAH